LSGLEHEWRTLEYRGKLDAEGRFFGANLNWSKGGRIVVQPPGPANWSVDIRTPLGLIDEGNDTFTLFYTAEDNKRFWPVSKIKLKMVKETQ